MKLHILETGKFKLDGGAMFGVVPKRMWNKLNPADEDNLCTWQMRCLLVEDGDRKILIDTGVGNKQDSKFKSHFYPHDEVIFDDALANIGLKSSDITDVFITHFHFDHVGGALKLNSKGNVEPAFGNATYWTNALQLGISPQCQRSSIFSQRKLCTSKGNGYIENARCSKWHKIH
jgi:glyoxylase-like metal-dependent hydrolase (beta-lactamase superfamily II)